MNKMEMNRLLVWEVMVRPDPFRGILKSVDQLRIGPHSTIWIKDKVEQPNTALDSSFASYQSLKIQLSLPGPELQNIFC